jgi:Tfp pilus assembly protein PilZ
MSVGGLFVETWEPFSVGQMITLSIPLTDNQGSVKFEGEVVRTDPQGIGVKFI